MTGIAVDELFFELHISFNIAFLKLHPPSSVSGTLSGLVKKTAVVSNEIFENGLALLFHAHPGRWGRNWETTGAFLSMFVRMAPLLHQLVLWSYTTHRSVLWANKSFFCGVPTAKKQKVFFSTTLHSGTTYSLIGGPVCLACFSLSCLSRFCPFCIHIFSFLYCL